MRRVPLFLTACVLATAALGAQTYPFEPLASARRGTGELRRGGDDRTALVEAEVHLRAGGEAQILVRSRRDEFAYAGAWRKDRGDYIKLQIDRAGDGTADAHGWVLVENRRFERIEIDGRNEGGRKLALSFHASGPELPLATPVPPVATPVPIPVDLFTEEFGYDQPGADLRSALAADLANCQRLCAEEPACRAYTFNSRDQRCYLKSEERPLLRRTDTVTGVRRGGGGGEIDGFSERPGYNLEGGDYTSVYLRSVEDCREACRSDRECLAYTFNTGSRMCYLKDRVGDFSPRRDTVSGVKARRLY
jgi:hypothetical protein